MKTKILNNQIIISLISLFFAIYLWLTFKTIKWRDVNSEIIIERDRFPNIYLYWHSRFIITLYLFTKYNYLHYVVLKEEFASKFTKKIILNLLTIYGIKFIIYKNIEEVSSQIKNLVSNNYNIIMCADETDLNMKLEKFPIELAQKNDIEIIPFTYSAKNMRKFYFFDNFFIPLPFSNGVISASGPFKAQKNEIDKGLRVIESQMRVITSEADQYSGYNNKKN